MCCSEESREVDVATPAEVEDEEGAERVVEEEVDAVVAALGEVVCGRIDKSVERGKYVVGGAAAVVVSADG